MKTSIKLSITIPKALVTIGITCVMLSFAQVVLGYEVTEAILGWKDNDASEEMQALIPRIKDSVRVGRPVLVWHAFTTAEWDVVAGFDDEKGVFLGQGSYAGLKGYAEAKQTRPQEATKICPAFGATFIGEKTGKFDARAAELAALREAVRHARDHAETHQPGRPDLEGLRAYDRWVEKFRKSDSSRDSGDSYCYYIYRSTHRAASGFLREIAPRYKQAKEALLPGLSRARNRSGCRGYSSIMRLEGRNITSIRLMGETYWT
jgi:hypothetical protein